MPSCSKRQLGDTHTIRPSATFDSSWGSSKMYGLSRSSCSSVTPEHVKPHQHQSERLADDIRGSQRPRCMQTE